MEVYKFREFPKSGEDMDIDFPNSVAWNCGRVHKDSEYVDLMKIRLACGRREGEQDFCKKSLINLSVEPVKFFYNGLFAWFSLFTMLFQARIATEHKLHSTSSFAISNRSKNN